MEVEDGCADRDPEVHQNLPSAEPGGLLQKMVEDWLHCGDITSLQPPDFILDGRHLEARTAGNAPGGVTSLVGGLSKRGGGLNRYPVSICLINQPLN